MFRRQELLKRNPCFRTSIELCHTMGKVSWSILFLILGGSSFLGAGGEGTSRLQVVRFMSEGVITTTSYLDAGYGALPTLSQATLCLHFRLSQFSKVSPFLSYYANDTNNEFMIGFRGMANKLAVIYTGYKIMTYIKIPPLSPFIWNHLCVAFSLETLSWLVVINDEVFDGVFKEHAGSPLTIAEGGHLVVGQELDSLNGSFSHFQTLIGEVADWVLLNETLNVEEMREYVACRGLPDHVHPILYLDKSLSGWELKGPSLSYNLTVDDVCSRKLQDSLVMFFQLMEQEEAADWCHKLGGVLPVPQNRQDNDDLTLLASEYESECRSYWGTVAWLGIKGNLTTGMWQKLSDPLPLAWKNFPKDYHAPSENCLCTTIRIQDRSRMWTCTPCREKTCVICQFAHTPFLYLRGLCKETGFDHVFMLKGDRGKIPMYVGYYKSRMSMRKDTWWLESTINGSKSFAYMKQGVITNPLGKHKWSIDSDECGQYETELVLSKCDPEQFPCDSGQCVPQEQRCDRKPDCYDKSDEQNCIVISLPLGYSPMTSPPPTSGDVLALLTSLEITSVRNFDLVGFKIGLDMILRVEWKDIRLQFFNLRDDIYSNRVKVLDRPWMPEFFVESSSRSPVETMPSSPSSLLVRRQHPPQADDMSRVTKEEVFDGADNSLVLEKQISVTLNCQFDLKMYPFDSQRCTFIYNVVNGDDVSFKVNSVTFVGDPKLLEYEVVGASGTANNSTSQASFWVEIKFRNQFGYYVGNAFLPSAFLVTICYLTFWFSLEDFQDRIMVSLTSLLVLTGLLTQTSQFIPKTAYLKFIDIWYITFIFVDFMIIVVLAVIERLRQRARSTEVKVMKVYSIRRPQKVSSVRLSQNGVGLAKKVNSISIVVFPVACTIFMVIYFALGLSNIEN